MSSTYTPIATTTGTGSASSIIFNSITGIYTDLILIANLNGMSVNNGFYLSIFPGQGIHSNTRLVGNGTTASSSRQASNASSFWLSGPTITDGGAVSIIASIMNYSNTTIFKTALIRTNNVASGTSAQVGLARSTSAVTSIAVATDGANIPTSSIFTLYGIKAE